MSGDAPEPDRLDGAPHPRDTPHLVGQDAAEQAFLRAHAEHRRHHAWLLTGPQGIGKATLAWRLARFLLATPDDDGMFGPPDTLDVAADHPVVRRMAAGSEPGLHIIRRPADEKTGKLRAVIPVDSVRRAIEWLHMSAADGTRRVVIVDSIDEMNRAAANAFLKILEEPPKRVTLILVSHQPAGLLPTIRSRCRVLRLSPLGPEDMPRALAPILEDTPPDAAQSAALAELAGGSVGTAVHLLRHDGLALYREIAALLDSAPRMDRPALQALAQATAGRGNEARFDLTLALLDTALARLARAGVAGAPPEAAPGEAALLARLSPDAARARLWATQAQSLGARARQGRAVNLDPAGLILDMGLAINETAGRATA